MCVSFSLKVFFGEFAEQIADDAAVVRAGGGTDGQDALDVQKERGDGRFRDDAHVQHRAGRAGKRGGKGLPRPCLGKNIAISPNVLLYDQNTSRQDEAERLRRIAGAQHEGVLREAFFLRVETGEHGVQLRLGNTGKQRTGTEHGIKIFHKMLLSLKIQPTC